jgi:uncharacterized OB-fold protein
MDVDTKFAFTVEGALALPYTYFAGETGSRFLIALRDEKKILAQKNPATGRAVLPPRKYDDTGLEPMGDGWVEVGPAGEVTGWTVVRYAEPSYQPKTPPYVLALVKLDGADAPIAHVVQGVEPAAMKRGMRVKAVFAETRKASILDIDHFEPV